MALPPEPPFPGLIAHRSPMTIGLPSPPLQGALELVGVEVEGIDHTITEISNQKVAGELAEWRMRPPYDARGHVRSVVEFWTLFLGLTRGGDSTPRE